MASTLAPSLAPSSSPNAAAGRARAASSSSARGRVAVVARGGSGAASASDDRKEELARMRASVQLASMNPSQETVVSAILDLSRQEFGLVGVKFAEIMAKVGECYRFDATASYVSGKGTDLETSNPPGVNVGSLKTYYFAHLHGLDEASTLRLFCEHYQDVLATPDGESHANIRAFMGNGWAGIAFDGEALRLRDGSEEDADVDQV